MKTILILYVPVMHKGYQRLIEKFGWVEQIYVLSQDFVEGLAEHVEIRALDPELARNLVRTVLEFSGSGPKVVKVLDFGELAYIRERVKRGYKIVIPNEALTRKFMAEHFPETEINLENSFLRWEEGNVLSNHDVPCDGVSSDPVDRDYMQQAEVRAEESSDWWRRVGAVLVTKRGVFRAHNIHVPTEYTPYINGDPRDSIKAGTQSEMSSVLHSEMGVFAQALQVGISTEGADLYTTVFPCPACAKTIAFSGVKRIFFKTGHASLDGAEILKVKGVKIIRVE